jgi:uncharacterized protein YndB with AHSA1/START domain
MNQHTVALTRVFEAPRERVFACRTHAEHLRHWFGPKGFTIHSCETDPREWTKAGPRRSSSAHI